MRVSKEKAAENRQHILTAAARLFREQGVSATGVDAITKDASLTHGAVYSQFGSKEAIAAEAIRLALQGSKRLWQRLAERKSVAFGPAKFALRGLAQSLARDLGPKGIHVAWVNVDGVIDIPGRRFAQLQEENLLKPDAIAETYWHLAHQDRSAWTMELEVRPFKEKF